MSDETKDLPRSHRAWGLINKGTVHVLSEPSEIERKPYVRLLIVGGPKVDETVLYIEPARARQLAQRLLLDADEADRRAA